MHIQLALLAVFCAVATTDAFRVVRSDTGDLATSVISNSTAKECCYPRPPRKRNMKRCCDLPIDDIYDHLQEEIKQCKEEMKKKKDELPAESSSTTTTVSTPPKEEEEEADLVDLEDSTSNEVEDASTSTTAATPLKIRQFHGRHHGGKGHGKKGSKGKCVKAIMEKRGWAKDGIVDYDAILKDTQKAAKPEAETWIPIMREAITNCSKQPLPVSEGDKHPYVPERAAYRCIKNNAMMNCPDFPENDAYCVELREVYHRCGARKQPGRRRFAWCDSNQHRSKIVA